MQGLKSALQRRSSLSLTRSGLRPARACAGSGAMLLQGRWRCPCGASTSVLCMRRCRSSLQAQSQRSPRMTELCSTPVREVRRVVPVRAVQVCKAVS